MGSHMDSSRPSELVATVIKEDGFYVACASDGIVSQGATLVEAIVNLSEALELAAER